MSQSEKNKLFQKYLSGDLSSEELHRLQEYALEDDFLFDALEGLSEIEGRIPTTLEDLNGRLQKKVRKKRSPLFLYIGSAAGAAAIALLLIFTPSPKQETLSDVAEIKKVSSVEEVEAPEVKEHNMKESLESEVAFSPTSTSIEKEAITSESNPSLDKSKDIPGLADEDSAFEEDRFTAQEEVEEINYSGIQAPDEEEKVQGEERDNLAFTNRTEPAPTLNPKLELSEERIPEIREREEGVVLDEVAVVATANNGKKFKKAAAKALTTQSPVNNIPTVSPSEQVGNALVGGNRSLLQKAWITVTIEEDQPLALSFQSYLIEKLDAAWDHQSFEVQFNLKKGKIIGDITVSASTNSALDEELSELIQSFDKWKGSGNKKMSVVVNSL